MTHGGYCHCHGRLARLSLDSFFISAKSNSSSTLVDLIYLCDPLSYLTHISSRSLSHDLYLSSKDAGYYYDTI